MSNQIGTPRLRDNIAALGMVQMGNYILPLITLPYLARVLGTEAFGKVAFAQSIMAYFVLLVEYGFSWSATRQVAAYRSNKAYLSRIFAATWAAQWLLVGFAALSATAIVLLSDRLRPDALLYAAAFTAVVGSVLFPTWFLQGLEQLKITAFLQILTRLAILVPIFLFVNQPSDVIWLLVFQGGAAIMGGALALYWIYRRGIINWRLPCWAEIMGAFRNGGALFGSRLAVSFYTALIPLTLGWIAGPIVLAYFNLADKIRGAAQSVLSPISQALFPRMSHLVCSNGVDAYKLIKFGVRTISVLGGVVGILLWLFADWLILVIGGESFAPAADVLRWLAPLPFIIGLSNVFGVQIMLPYRLNRWFSTILIAAAAISIVIVVPFVHHYGAIGAAQTVLIVETCVTCLMAALLVKKGFFKKDRWIKVSV